jgi:hypothetical protein
MVVERRSPPDLPEVRPSSAGSIGVGFSYGNPQIGSKHVKYKRPTPAVMNETSEPAKQSNVIQAVDRHERGVNALMKTGFPVDQANIMPSIESSTIAPQEGVPTEFSNSEAKLQTVSAAESKFRSVFCYKMSFSSLTQNLGR